MSEKPEALRLANDLEAFYRLTGEGGMDAQAADELLHQHAEIERLKAENERLREALPYDWNMLEACRGSLREHMAEIKRLRGLLLDIRKDEQTSHWHRDIDAAMEDKT